MMKQFRFCRHYNAIERIRILKFYALCVAFFAATCCQAQMAKVSLFAGTGTKIAGTQRHSATQLGASFDVSAPNRYFGCLFEGGYLGSNSNFGTGSGFFSANYLASWTTDKRLRFFPFATFGYTRLLRTNALNFGGGLDYRVNRRNAIRFEVRDYHLSSGPSWYQGHNVGLQVGYVFYIPDF